MSVMSSDESLLGCSQCENILLWSKCEYKLTDSEVQELKRIIFDANVKTAKLDKSDEEVILNCSTNELAISGLGSGENKTKNINAFKKDLPPNVNSVACENCGKLVVLSTLTARQYTESGIPICPSCYKPLNLDDMNMASFAKRLSKNESIRKSYFRNADSVKLIDNSPRKSISVYMTRLSFKAEESLSLDSKRKYSYNPWQWQNKGMFGDKGAKTYVYSMNDFKSYDHDYLPQYTDEDSPEADDLLYKILKYENINKFSVVSMYRIPDYLNKKSNFESSAIRLAKTVQKPSPRQHNSRRILLLIDESEGAKTAFQWYIKFLKDSLRDTVVFLCISESNRYKKRFLPPEELSLLIRCCKTIPQKIRRMKLLSKIYCEAASKNNIRFVVLFSLANSPEFHIKSVLEKYLIDFAILSNQKRVELLAHYKSLSQKLRTLYSHPIIIIPNKIRKYDNEDYSYKVESQKESHEEENQEESYEEESQEVHHMAECICGIKIEV